MDFEHSERAREMVQRVEHSLTTEVLPRERE